MTPSEICDQLRPLADSKDACLTGTPMVPISQATLRAIIDALTNLEVARLSKI